MTGKINRMITVNPEIWDKFQRLFPGQASSYCNEQMRLRIAYSQGDLSGVDMEILKVQEREALRNVDSANAALTEVREKLTLIASQTEKEEKERLEEEKERLEAISKCDGCGKQMVTPKVTVKDLKFCTECFMNEHPAFIKAQKRS